MDITTDLVLKLLLAMVLGGLIGYDRERKHKEAGLRTHVLVCLTSVFLIAGSIGYLGEDKGEVARVIQALITGIGFLGAGTIISRGKHIRGLTTAASVWCVAALGIIIGLGEFALAIIITGLVLLLLRLTVMDQMFSDK